MTKENAHRGPDSTDYVIASSYAFGFNRLQIVGGAEGAQPIVLDKGNLILICNGEIFNYKELKNKYCFNSTFKTTSDVEIIAHLYRFFGKKFVKLLKGQFAFVLLDKRKKRVIMARDRFGIIPLFYTVQNNYLVVSSEIKSIFASGLVKKPVFDQPGLIENYFFYGAQPPRTCFQNIHQCSPATQLIFDTKRKNIQSFEYWKLKKISNNNLGYRLKDTLENSISSMLMGDSNPAIYLSGGLDSSIIAYLSNKLSPRKITAFSITFPNTQYDESHYQKILASYLNVKLVQISVTYKTVRDNFKKTIYHTETPISRTASVPLLLLSKKVREYGIKYVLCGEGSDELFAGYPVFRKEMSSIESKWESRKLIFRFIKSKAVRKHIQRTYKSLTNERTTISTLRKREIKTKLSGYLLTNQGDRMSMAHGVEQRFPFLDHNVAELAFSLSKKELIQNNRGKAVLRETFKNDIPKEIILRRKQGYLAPDTQILMKLMQEESLLKYVSEKSIQEAGIFSPEEVMILLTKLESSSEATSSEVSSFIFILSTQILWSVFNTIYPSYNEEKN